MLLIALLPACRTTKKAYERGDYETAVFNSIERLRRSPNNKKSRETLRQAYPDMVATLQGEINDAKLSPDPLRWERVVRYYEVLNRAYDEIQRAPAARQVIRNPQNFQTDYNQALRQAAEVRYTMGNQALAAGKAGDRERAKEAYAHFQRALELRPGYRDSERLMLEAQSYATLIVEIEPIPMHSRSLALSNEFFENQLTEYLATAPFSPFVRFVTVTETQALSRDPDHILQMSFDDFVVGQAYVKETVAQRIRDSVVVGTHKVTEDSTVDVYGKVEAEVHRFRKEISSGGLLDLRILDARTGAVLTQRKFPGTFIWEDRWGFFQGDKRALNDEDKQYMRKQRESPNPPPQDLFIEFTKPIFSQVTQFVGAYYRDR
ncbi:MAG: hypothetical protein D6722_14040 [Bacteroidetes bacterium]|nr:MAG: hypothetical protein D6722_14040 [Bacteroidota bacterium]